MLEFKTLGSVTFHWVHFHSKLLDVSNSRASTGVTWQEVVQKGQQNTACKLHERPNRHRCSPKNRESNETFVRLMHYSSPQRACSVDAVCQMVDMEGYKKQNGTQVQEVISMPKAKTSSERPSCSNCTWLPICQLFYSNSTLQWCFGEPLRKRTAFNARRLADVQPWTKRSRGLGALSSSKCLS